MKSIKIPDSIVELESYAFAGCSSLESAELPANNHLLGELIFTGCHNLKEIRIFSKIPPKFDCNSTLFDPDEAEMYHTCRLVTLITAEPLYEKSDGWKLFSSAE
jgi:hypothetical protein